MLSLALIIDLFAILSNLVFHVFCYGVLKLFVLLISGFKYLINGIWWIIIFEVEIESLKDKSVYCSQLWLYYVFQLHYKIVKQVFWLFRLTVFSLCSYILGIIIYFISYSRILITIWSHGHHTTIFIKWYTILCNWGQR